MVNLNNFPIGVAHNSSKLHFILVAMQSDQFNA